jgi:hypothetical protein
MLRHILCATLLMAGTAHAEIPDSIDSSKWAVDPVAYGMTAKEYIQAESRAFLSDFIGRSGLNQFFHFTGLSTAADTWVVSPNNDTIYSIAAVNATQGFTVDIPDVGDRFVSVQIITENHMTPFYYYESGPRTFSADDFDTDFVGVGVRMGATGTAEDVAYVTPVLQPQYKITGAASEDTLTRPDLDLLAKVRAPLVAEYNKLPNSFATMKKQTTEVDDWERFTYVTAGAWGLSEDENAMYAIGGPKDAKGGKCYTATFPPVPVKAFYSITLYGPQNYLMTDKDNIVSSNRGVINNDDGSFTVAFGSDDCRSLAPNFANTPEDGWSFLLRAYRPDVEAFRKYQMPEVVPAE